MYFYSRSLYFFLYCDFGLRVVCVFTPSENGWDFLVNMFIELGSVVCIGFVNG